MKIISFKEFNRIYQETVKSVYQYWTPEMQHELSTHCYSWSPDCFDFRNYLEVSVIRYYRAYHSFADNGGDQSLCDVGGFWGVFAITMKALGVDVAMTESLKYYGTAFTTLFNYISKQGVNIVDYDPFEVEPLGGEYDFVTVMAVLEHYPHSLRVLMRNLISLMKPEGSIYLEVPNIAYWPKRWNLLHGQSPLPPIRDIYQSEIPFVGHHHEFTISELRSLAGLADLTIEREFFYTYSPRDPVLKRFVNRPMETMIQWMAPKTRECLAIVCHKRQNRDPTDG